MANRNNNDIASAILDTCANKSGGDLEMATKKVVRFLARKRLLSKSKQILATVEKLASEKSGVMFVVLKSAYPINASVQNEIATLLKNKYNKEKVVFEEKIVPGLLGGFRVEIGDEVIDITLLRKLNKIELELSR